MPLSTLAPFDKAKPLKWCRNLFDSEKWCLIKRGLSLSWNNKPNLFVGFGKHLPSFFVLSCKQTLCFVSASDSRCQNFPRTVTPRHASDCKSLAPLQAHPYDRAMLCNVLHWMQMGVLLKIMFFQKLFFKPWQKHYTVFFPMTGVT